jgi:hypothetical protein
MSAWLRKEPGAADAEWWLGGHQFREAAGGSGRAEPAQVMAGAEQQPFGGDRLLAAE